MTLLQPTGSGTLPLAVETQDNWWSGLMKDERAVPHSLSREGGKHHLALNRGCARLDPMCRSLLLIFCVLLIDVFTADRYLLPLPASSLTLTLEPALLAATSYCLPLLLLSPILLLISTYFPRDETKILHIIIFYYYFNFLSN